MKIEIEPKKLWVPGKGEITVNLLLVDAKLNLGVGASSFYDLQRRSMTDKQTVDESFGLVGNMDLTPEQFAKWGMDDAYFAECIAENLGLVPVAQ